jgi:hypothetical protein
MAVEMQSVVSENIAARGFDADTGTLHVHFRRKDGEVDKYSYPFTQEKYDEFCKAESAGKHFHKFIKGHPDHPHTKL